MTPTFAHFLSRLIVQACKEEFTKKYPDILQEIKRRNDVVAAMHEGPTRHVAALLQLNAVEESDLTPTAERTRFEAQQQKRKK